MRDDDMQLTDKDERKKTDRRLSKKHIQGFIAGLIVAIIFFMVVKIGVDTDSLTGTSVSNTQSDDLLISSYLTDSDTGMSDGDQELYQELYKSDKPVIVYYTNNNFDENNEYVKVIRRVIGDCEIVKGDKFHEDSRDYFEAYYQGNKITRHTITTPVEVFSYWLQAVNEQWEDKPVPTSNPEPTPIPTPTFYKVFPADINGNFSSYSDFDIDHTCELKLTTYGFASKGTIECKAGVKLNVKEYTGIYALLQNKYGGDSSWFGIPDLTSIIPLEGLQYEMLSFGAFLDRSEEKMITGTDGLNYLATDIEPYENISIGQIILAKDIDENKYSSILLPCDGRELDNANYLVLYNVIGNKFGSAGGESFRLPDLSALSPIEGAKYYIVTKGRYPEGNW